MFAVCNILFFQGIPLPWQTKRTVFRDCPFPIIVVNKATRRVPLCINLIGINVIIIIIIIIIILQDFLTRFPIRLPTAFPARISHKIFLQNFPTRFPAIFSHKISLSWILIGSLPITLFQMLNFHQSLPFLNWLFAILPVPQDFPARFFCKNFPQDFPTRFS